MHRDGVNTGKDTDCFRWMVGSHGLAPHLNEMKVMRFMADSSVWLSCARLWDMSDQGNLCLDLVLRLPTFCLYLSPILPKQSLGSFLLGFPDLANKNKGCLAKLEFQINKLEHNTENYLPRFKFESLYFILVKIPLSPNTCHLFPLLWDPWINIS